MNMKQKCIFLCLSGLMASSLWGVPVDFGAYDTRFVQQGDDDGYFLGVDSHGYAGFMVKVDGEWQQLSVPNKPPYADANHLALSKWYYAAGTYNKDDGTPTPELPAVILNCGGPSRPIRPGSGIVNNFPFLLLPHPHPGMPASLANDPH